MHHGFKCKIWNATKGGENIQNLTTIKRIPKFDNEHEMGKQKKSVHRSSKS